MRRAIVGLLIGGGVALTGPAWAAGGGLDAQSMQGQKLRVDGTLREWRGRMIPLGEKVQGRPESGLSAAAMLGYDEKNLYLALKVADDTLTRTRAAGAGEDHATLLVAFPSGRGYQTHQVTLYPGEPGKLPGVVKVGGRKLPGAKLVEAPAQGGFTFEAQIPWKAFPEASRMRVGLRGAVRYTDADAAGAVEGTIGTSRAGAGAALPPLLLESEQALEDGLIRAKGLSSKPAKQLFGNVAGDAMLERVALYDGFLTIVGPHYREGQQFYFSDLSVRGPELVTRLELSDFDGDGRDEIVIQKRVGASDQYREVLQVLKVGADDAPFVAFTHEVGLRQGAVEIQNAVKLSRNGRTTTLEISQGKADGVDASYDEPQPGDYASVLLPWERVKSRRFSWQKDSIRQTDETPWEPKMGPPTGEAQAAGAAPTGPPPPPPPRPPSADELLDQVYALYRKDRGVGKAEPSFDFVTDVAGDRQPERVLVHGKDIVVFGKGYKGGTSYTYISVGVAQPKDILDVTARDLTGDGKAEIMLRGIVRAQTSEELGGVVVDRHALLIYKVTDAGLRRVFGAETGREVEGKRVLGAVGFQPGRSGLAIELKPGRALGWTEQSYPFPADTTAAGGLEPLLLPWGSAAQRRYEFDGTSYAPR